MKINTLIIYFGYSTIILINYFYFRTLNLFSFGNKYHFRKVYYSSIFLLLKCLKFIKYDFSNDLIDVSTKNQIFVCNHISFIDSIVIIAYFYNCAKGYEKINMIGSQRFFKYPIIGYLFKNLGVIPIKFSSNKKECNTYDKNSVDLMFEQSIKLINEGESLLILPEGRLNTTPNKLNEIKSGAFNIHKKTNVPITIFGMKGNEKIWKAYEHPSGEGLIKVKCLKENIYYENIDDYKNDIKNSIEHFINE